MEDKTPTFEGFPILPILDNPVGKKKRTVEDYDALLWNLVDQENPPKATRFLNLQIMCGACKFKCCNSEVFSVEISEEERSRYISQGLLPPDTGLAWKQNGSCHCLNESGCKFGEDRPAFCKMYPLHVDFEKGTCGTSHWVLTHCPMPKHFEFVGIQDGKYVYRKRDDLKGPVKGNIQGELRLDRPLEEWPTILESNAEGLAEVYSPEMVEQVREQLRTINEGEPDGFDLGEF